MGKKMTDKDRDMIVANSMAFNMSNKKNAEATGYTESAVYMVLKILETVKNEDWNQIVYKVTVSGWSFPTVEWAAARTNKTIPEWVYSAYKSRVSNKGSEDQEASTPQPVPNPNDDAFFVNVLTTLNAIQQSNIAIIDALSALAADLKTNNNVNTDVVSQILEKIITNMEAIKNNTRKKGL